MVFHRVLSHRPPNEEVTPEALGGDSLRQTAMFLRCNFDPPIAPPRGFELVVPDRSTRMVAPANLESFRSVEIDMVLECAGNGRTLMKPVPKGVGWRFGGVSPVTVRGVRLSEFLGTLPEETVDVVFTGADKGVVAPEGAVPYQFSLSRDMALSPVPLLVTHIGGETLTLQHGAPMRLMVPGQYAMKSVKWLTKVEAVDRPFRGHFVRKYVYLGDGTEPDGSPVGAIAVRSIISSPVEGEGVPAGFVEMRGSAWSGNGEIASVEVSIDAGETWLPTDLIQRETGGRWAPVQWATVVDPPAGRLTLMCRATDTTGDTQSLEPRWNVNGYANNIVHRVNVEVFDFEELYET